MRQTRTNRKNIRKNYKKSKKRVRKNQRGGGVTGSSNGPPGNNNNNNNSLPPDPSYNYNKEQLPPTPQRDPELEEEAANLGANNNNSWIQPPPGDPKNPPPSYDWQGESAKLQASISSLKSSQNAHLKSALQMIAEQIGAMQGIIDANVRLNRMSSKVLQAELEEKIDDVENNMEKMINQKIEKLRKELTQK